MSNIFRKLLVQAIGFNGGYSRGYHDRWALSWEVGLYYANLDKNHIYEVMKKDVGDEPMHPDLEWDPEQQWMRGQEDLAEGLNDDDGRRTYSPETAARHGLPYHKFPRRFKRYEGEIVYYPAKLKGWILDDPYECKYFDVEFGLAGRGGKHLVVERFEGINLALSSDELIERIEDQSNWHFSNQWCRNLLAMIDEWDKMFTSKNASKELEYQAANRMYCELCDLNKEQAERQFWAERDVATKSVCRC